MDFLLANRGNLAQLGEPSCFSDRINAP